MANGEHRKFQWDFQLQKQAQYEAKVGDYMVCYHGIVAHYTFSLDHVTNPVGCLHGHGSKEVASSTV